MRLAISNIAWDICEDEAVAALLQQFSVDAIDIAPGKYFPELTKATGEDIAQVKAWWAERGVEITGMQALLFGTKGLNIFARFESAIRGCFTGGSGRLRWRMSAYFCATFRPSLVFLKSAIESSLLHYLALWPPI